MENNILDNYEYWLIAKQITISFPKNKELSLGEISKTINVCRTHPYFCKLMEFLIDNDIVKVKKIIGRTKIITINISKLDNLIENSRVYSNFTEYIEHKRLVYKI